MVAATLMLLLAALALQLVFYRDGGHHSISDLPRVFLHRGIRPGVLPFVDRPVEYPVLAGVFLYLASLVWASPFGVLLVTALAASAVCVAVTLVLERRFGARAWRWALAAPLVLYAFQNWDVFAVAAMLAGLLAFERHRDGAAGVWLGVGAAIKLFPAVVVLPLAALRWSVGDRRGAIRLVVGALGTLALVNLPFLIVNPPGWWWPLAFQSHRNATWGSAWFLLLRVAELPVHGVGGAHVANLVSLLALVAALAWLTFVTFERKLPPFHAAAAAVVIFVLCNKVYSPTYDVWLVVFFVAVPLSRRLWVAFCAVDLAVFVTVYGYFAAIEPVSFVRTVLPVLVIVRTGVLLAVVAVATRRTNAGRDLEAVPVGADARGWLRATQPVANSSSASWGSSSGVQRWSPSWSGVRRHRSR